MSQWWCPRSTRFLAVLVAVITALATPTGAQEPASSSRHGVVEGRVVAARTGDPLPGAKVIVTGSSAETSTDRDGSFRLGGVPPGNQTVVVTYLGWKESA